MYMSMKAYGCIRISRRMDVYDIYEPIYECIYQSPY